MPFVHPIPGLLPQALVAELRASLLNDDANWVDGRRTAGRDGGKKHNRELETGSPLRQRLSDRLSAALTSAATPEAVEFRYAADPRRVGPFRFPRTGAGGGHADTRDTPRRGPRTPGG